MMTSRIVIATIGAVALSGCVSFGPKAPKVLLTLNSSATVAVDAAHTAGPGQTVTILYPSAPAAIATTRVPVYDGSPNVAYVKDAAWNDSPAHLFQHLVSETVAAKTGRVVLDLKQYSLDPGTRVSGQLIQFGVDAAAMQAVVTFDGVLVRSGAKGVETRRFESRMPLSTVDAASIGPAINQAANTVASQVADWVGR